MSVATAIWLNGEPAEALPLPDRGFDFGDGLFETMLLHRGQALYPQLHFDRLARGLEALGFPNCLTLAQNHLEQASSSAHGCEWVALRLTVSRGGGPRGYATPLQPQPRILIQLTELDRDCSTMNTPATLCDASIRLATQPMLAGIKHLNRLEQVLAATQARDERADEALLLDQSGQLNSVTAGNLFLVRKEQLFTPVLDDCGVRGTRRQLVMERWAPAIGLELREEVMGFADLAEADEVFYSNALQGLRPIANIGRQCWDDFPVCQALFNQYRSDYA